ncbi:glycine-rich protein [Arabidopsis thaliana]|uniref:Glycine-rich protein n=1 Tax=Arabidopsis thaliana TaxID=3702 RepID=A8MQJ2_ARATH|nr:glycine-rich protein [Arabidopsis thaliana]AEE74113.1 glycine-rich protein [Arabidopsis thaliana]|eukprot:NP_001078106.1 glycine-rich protein [Arabidopsis thaliana]
MDLKKASLFLFLLLCLHLQLQHHFAHAVSRSSTSLAFVDPNHDDLPFQEVELKPDGDVIEANLPKLTVVVKKGGGGGGLRPIPIYGGGTHRSGHHSSGGRETASGWLGLSILAGLGLVF